MRDAPRARSLGEPEARRRGFGSRRRPPPTAETATLTARFSDRKGPDPYSTGKEAHEHHHRGAQARALGTVRTEELASGDECSSVNQARVNPTPSTTSREIQLPRLSGGKVYAQPSGLTPRAGRSSRSPCKPLRGESETGPHGTVPLRQGRPAQWPGLEPLRRHP